MSNKPVMSPSYPSVSLDKVLEMIKKIETQYCMTPVDRGDAANLLGYTSLSGPANKTLAALASYGLVARSGKGMIRVTELGSALSNPLNESEYKESLLEAAEKPPLYKKIREHFDGLSVPPLAGIETFLNRSGFNPNSVTKAAKAFYSTMELIEQSEDFDSHGAQSDEPIESQVPMDKTVHGGVSLDDSIQWSIQGVPQFEQPKQVRWISDNGEHLAVEGSNEIIPMEQVSTTLPSAVPVAPQVPPQVAISPQKVSGLTEWFRAKVGSDKLITINFQGDGEIGPREIEKMIAILEAQKLALED